MTLQPLGQSIDVDGSLAFVRHPEPAADFRFLPQSQEAGRIEDVEGASTTESGPTPV